MGWGDELMAAGQAERLFRADPSRPVIICDRRGVPRWSPVWAHNPAIVNPRVPHHGRVQKIRNAVGCRPYIQYPFTRELGHRFTDWRARDHLGMLYFTDEERAIGQRVRAEVGRFFVLEPGVKMTGNPNKSWGDTKFTRVISELSDLTFVRVSWDEPRPFPGLRHVIVRSFREACAVIAASDGYVGTEGGYHHAAAVLRKPGVVIFGGFVSPITTGYPSHINLADEGPGSPCGRWQPCQHCATAMEGISVEQVVASVRSLAGCQKEAACQ